jgi:hypothetical protein
MIGFAVGVVYFTAPQAHEPFMMIVPRIDMELKLRLLRLEMLLCV